MGENILKTNLIDINHLSISFPNQQLFQDLSFSIAAGDFTAIIGENGVGKTTLIRILLGQIRPTTGTLVLNPELKIGYVPQFRNIDSEYPLSIRDFISLGFTNTIRPWLSKAERETLNKVIERVGLNKIANYPLGQASGGQKQRAYLAQALVRDPNLLILDESTASLDITSKNELLRVISQLNAKYGLAVIFISHDLDLVKEYAKSFVWIKRNDDYLTGTISELPESFK